MSYDQMTSQLVLNQKAKRSVWTDLHITLSPIPTFWGESTYLKRTKFYMSLYIPSEEDKIALDWVIF